MGPLRILSMFARALIVLLLVLNLGVAVWWLLRPEPAAPGLPAHPAGVPRLQLLREAGVAASAPATAPQPAAASTATAATPPRAAAPAEGQTEEPTAESTQEPIAPARCFSFGPYTDAAQATAARTKLPAGVLGARLRSEAARRGGSWNVLMSPQADRAAAQALAQRIDAAGFKDYYVIGEGASANGIALGRFGSEDAARRHQSALQAAGFQAQLQAPAGSGATWLDVDAGPSFDAEAVRTALAATRAQPRDCAAGA